MKQPTLLIAALLLLAFPTLLLAQDSAPIPIPNQAPETETGLWIEKGTRLQFHVTGSWTMWAESWPEVDARGHVDFKKVGTFRLGELVGKIAGGKAFPIHDGGTLLATESGMLSVWPNRGDYRMEGRGSLELSVDGAIPVSKAEAEQRAGWDLSVLDTARNEDYLTEAEKDVFLLVNKARVDPPRFAKQYLADKQDQGAYARECYQELLATTAMKPLLPSRALWLAAKEHADDMGRSGKTGHTGTKGSSLSGRINQFGIWDRSISENCSYGFADPLGIVLQLLIDDGVPSRGHRKNIMNRETAFMGTSIAPHRKYDWNCVQDFAGAIRDKP